MEKQEDPYCELARGAGRWRQAGSEGLSAIGRHRAINRGALGAHTIESPSPISSPWETRIVRTLAVGPCGPPGRGGLAAAGGRPRRLGSRPAGWRATWCPARRPCCSTGSTTRQRVAEALAGWRPEEAPTGPSVEMAVTYDGPDLPFVAAQWGCPVDEVVARHQRTEFVSAFCGFAPGFAYLSGLDHDVPRLATPRTRVPAGSVALAGRWCGVYPGDSPGGWRLIGTDRRRAVGPRPRPAGPARPRGARQVPGRVAAPLDPCVRGAMSLHVREVGPSVLVQDLGRPGWAHLGVPRDPALSTHPRPPWPSGSWATRPTRPVSRSCSAGSSSPPTRTSGSRSPAPRAASRSTGGRRFGAAVWLPAGAELRLGRPASGLRTYVACAGGSRSSRSWDHARPTRSDGSGPRRSQPVTSCRWGVRRGRPRRSTRRAHPPPDRCG